MLNNNTASTGDNTPVSYARHSYVGVIRIASPPVNALGQAVRQGIVDALQQALADDDAEVIVLLAAGRTFIAGADIREFGKPPQAPLLSDVVASLEASPKPLIAVLHGTALGGGLEVALGCHLRIALEGTRIAVSGTATDVVTFSDATNITVDDGSGEVTVRVWRESAECGLPCRTLTARSAAFTLTPHCAPSILTKWYS